MLNLIHNRRISGSLLFLLVVFTFGCRGEINIPGDPVGRTVSFAQDIQPIFNTKCISCHSEGSFASSFAGIDMRLVEGQSYDFIVDQPSSQNPAFTLVEPGDANASLIFLKVSSNDPPVGDPMPLIGDTFTSEELALLRDWIDQGALDN